MEAIVQRIIAIRQRVCPKTSYATAGSASNILFLISASQLSENYTIISNILLDSKEFDSVKIISDVINQSMWENVQGHVVLFLNPNENSLQKLAGLVANQTTLLTFALFLKATMSSLELMKDSLEKSVEKNTTFHQENFEENCLFICYRNATMKTKIVTSVHNVQSSIWHEGYSTVRSREQFRHLWMSKIGLEGKMRVLQRLADKKVIQNGKQVERSEKFWDSFIKQKLDAGCDDFHIYSAVRLEYMGTSLEHDLAISNCTAPAVSESGPESKHTASPDGIIEPDGRSDFLVNMTLKCIPISHQTRIASLLDYGCAEGALTANLAKRLNISESVSYGADVRCIPAKGFTFVHIPSDEECRDGRPLLPSLHDRSIDLVTASMVLHHVRHVDRTLSELRRLISPQGVLVLREHHCATPDIAMFLDIVHGFYSLCWCPAVEWPAFLDEYVAYYRPREEWTRLLAAAGFQQYEGRADTAQDRDIVRQYDAPRYSTRKGPLNKYSNVILAYYAVYTPSADSGQVEKRSLKRPLPQPREEESGRDGGKNTKAILPVPQAMGAAEGRYMDVYESGTHRGHYFVLEQGRAVWIAGGGLASDGSFPHPVDGSACRVGKLHRAAPSGP